jgi:ribosomal protein S18 acetylase RimI-like enzyme
MQVVFRAAETEDVTAIRELGIATWWSTYMGLIPSQAIAAVLRQGWHQAVIGAQIKSERHRVLVAQTATEVIGVLFAVSPFAGADVIVIERLYVRPDFQGQAVGYGLWRTLVERLPREVRAVELDVLAGNERALAFYRRLGFAEIRQFVDSVAGIPLPLVHMRAISPFLP